MRFITVRDLRLKPGHVWKLGDKEKDLVITSNGRPVALLTRINAETLDQEISALQRARALVALESLQRESVKKGTDKILSEEIQAEIQKVRKESHC